MNELREPGQKRAPRRALGAGAANQASTPARRQAAAILEVLAGVRTPTDAAQVLGISVARYYLLERRALAGLLSACEPSPRGPRADASRRVALLEKQLACLQQECARRQALVRAAQRAMGLAPPQPQKSAGSSDAKEGSKPRRARRPAVRALKMASALHEAHLHEAHLHEAHLHEAHLHEAHLDEAHLDEADPAAPLPAASGEATSEQQP